MKIKLLPFILISLSFVFTSCSSMVSGRYITLTDNYSSQKLGQLFNVESWKIEEVNKAKTFKKGQRVFLPFKGGLLSEHNNSRKVASINYSEILSSSRFLWPVPSSSRITSNYGRRWGRSHEGLDVAARGGAHILASDNGVVVYSGRELGGYGNITVIAHSGGFFTVYAHAKKNFTRKGQKVNRGQVIALVGSTGKSTGNHLHFEIRKDSHAFDPSRFFKL